MDNSMDWLVRDEKLINHTVAILEYCQENNLMLTEVKDIASKIMRKMENEIVQRTDKKLVVNTDSIYKVLEDPWHKRNA